MEDLRYSCSTGPNLENRILKQASSSLLLPPSWGSLNPSCSALRPSALSSTASSSALLSTSSSLLSSSLLSTEKTQLNLDLPIISSLCSSHPLSSLIRSTAPPTGSEAHACLTGEHKERIIKDDVSCSSEEFSSYSELDESVSQEEEMEVDHEPLVEMPVLDLRPTKEEEEKMMLDVDEGFGEFNVSLNKQDELLKEMKYKLLNLVYCSLIQKSQSPGEPGWNDYGNVWVDIQSLGKDIILIDPEFILKVAVYTRQELNIRVTANFLLALAAYLPCSQVHLRRYFCSAVQLPSDWLEVIRIYSTCFGPSLPSCLKKALPDKFKQFSEYQLAKYNTRKHRCKHKTKRKIQEVPHKKWSEWAQLVASEPDSIKKYLKEGRSVVDKKQNEFNMKKLIKKLHIKEPAEHVMGILEKRYPADVKAFWRSGLSGVWQSQRANQRMKLKQVETWETRLSREGNSATTWEKLLDNNSVPFMAMLRNLRNMITQGISPKHHDKVLKRLSSKSAIIQSRQFPFRFLSAYKVVLELKKFVGGGVKEKPSSKEVLRGILKKIPKSRKYTSLDWSTAPRTRLRITLNVPFVRGLYFSKLKAQEKARLRRYTPELLQRYCQALEKAIQISCRFNIPPLSGNTLIILINCFSSSTLKGANFCLPPESSDENVEKSKLAASSMEVALLLSMMITYCSEHVQFLLGDNDGLNEVQLESDGLLENVRRLASLISNSSDSSPKLEPSVYFSKLLEERTKVDNIILVCENWVPWRISSAVKKFHKVSLNRPLVVNLLLGCASNNVNMEDDPTIVNLNGFSEQILRFISERGSSRLLDHVEQIDKLYKVPPPTGSTAQPERTNDIMTFPAVPKLRWRGVRVFISSTFRDMHGERDVLVRSVFPELQRRAAPLCLHLQEVDLRWGVTEDESARATEICLQEVCRSQVLLGILGERYGLVPPRPSLPELPQYSWLDSALDGLSVTEMEIRQFQAMFPDSAQSRMFFYFRSPQLLSSVPEAWRDDFAAESGKDVAKMDKLKKWIKNNNFSVTENYPCEWGGVVDGKAYVKGLEDFAKAVIEDLWAVIQKLFVEETDEVDLTAEMKEQEVYQDAQRRQFFGRVKLLLKAKQKIEECLRKGGVLLVEGGPGVGKTAFMAALDQSLQTPDKMNKVPICDVISYSTAASQSASGVEPLLRCLIQWLRKRSEQIEELPSNTSYKDLLSELLSHLNKVKKGRPLAVLVDGADLVHNAAGQSISEWIPQHVPKGVCLVLSVATDSDLRHTLSRNKSCMLFPLGPLLLPDRRQIVQKELSVYGKKLSDSAFNNQLQTLLMKKGAMSPLYLRLACEELRNYASFEKMKENLQCLPSSLCELIKHGLIRLQAQYEGTGLNWALAALTVSSDGLKEQDLHFLLNLCTDLNSTYLPLYWQKAIKHARNPKIKVPMATFSQLARSLQSLIRSSLFVELDQYWVLTNPDVKSAFEQLYLSDPDDRTRAHMILAAYLWVRSDPCGDDTFLHCDAEALAHLPVHLMKCSQWEPIQFLLCSYYFMYANVRHGLLTRLMENYVLYEKNNNLNKLRCPDVYDEVMTCNLFLKRHAPLFSHLPAMFVQQALNEPDVSTAHVWAKHAVEQGNIHVVRWMNSSGKSQQETGELLSTFKFTPSCVSLSPAGGLMAVGTEQGSLHLYHTHTNQEVKSLHTNCDGISGCVFLDERVVWTTSYDGQMEAWDVNSGCRTAHLAAHSNRITGCDLSRDRKLFATVSLDFTLKVWSSQKGREEVSLLNPCPLNCVTFDPEGNLVAVGCWDGAVRVWDWIKQENCTTLSGHQCTVRSVSFSPSSSLSLLCSGTLNGEIRLWSVSGSSCVWCHHAHRGSTEALQFLCDGELLLSAGQDGIVQLWSGGLGRSVAMLGDEKKLLKSSGSKDAAVSEDAALCVAVKDQYAAVGYHGNGLKLYNIESGVCEWSTEDLRVSMLCLLWLQVSNETVLLSGGFDQRLRLWRKRKGHKDALALKRVFGVQKGAVLALNQNSCFVVSASDDFTISLWLKSDLTSDLCAEPKPLNVLRGHSGGVTCLAFSPSGDLLLSGGKDKALMVWTTKSSTNSLVRALPHCHGDWITGCAWTPSTMLSCSNDCRLRLWDVQTGCCISEVSTMSSVGTLCCWENYVMFGSADGQLTVWKSDLGVITEIKAHSSRLHHAIVISQPGQVQNPKDILIATASDDGSVKLWHPLQVEHRSTLLGHSGGVQALESGSGPRFLTVSEDRSLRAWSVGTEMPPRQMERVSALCFLKETDVLVCAFSSGRLEIWKQLQLVYTDQLSDSCITAVSSMPHEQLAVGFSDASVSVWQLEKNSKQSITGLTNVATYSVKSSVMLLHYCTTLLGVCVDSKIIDVFPTERGKNRTVDTWQDEAQVFGIVENGNHGMWLLGEYCESFNLAYLHAQYKEEPEKQGRKKKQRKNGESQGWLKLDSYLDLNSRVDRSQEQMEEEEPEEKDVEQQEEEQEQESRKCNMTAAALHNGLLVCGDLKGRMWFNRTRLLDSWTRKKPVHRDRISALRLTDRLIISGSYDRTIKLWDRNTKKQLGLFVCNAPVEVLQVNPNDSSQIVCGDTLGQIYFLSWTG